MTRWCSSPDIWECAMNRHVPKLTRGYILSLRTFLAHGQESALARAYELGRNAIAKGLGVLDMARVHQEALTKVMRSPARTKDEERIIKSAETFLLESLSPFEATHRGFRETNLKLAERNRELEAEVKERKRVEDALRRSEKHYQRLFNEAQTMQENLRNLSNRILHTQEEERKRISRELHDEVGQSLTAINVVLGTLRNAGAGNSEGSDRKLAEVQDLLKATMETVHNFARELRPAMLDELGLLPALRSYLKGFAGRTGLRVSFHGNPISERLADVQKTVVFRIAQESLTNVNKHARASRVEIAIRKFQDGICMEVKDDGRSFDVDRMTSARTSGRLGLLGMQERARLINGQVTIKPQPGKGTTVHVVIPFDPSTDGMPLPSKLDRGTGQRQFVSERSEIHI